MPETNVLIMAHDKSGIIEFGEALNNADIGIVATEKTAAYLKESSQLPVLTAYDFLLSSDHSLKPLEREMLEQKLEEVQASSDDEDRSRRNDRLNADIGHLLARSLSEHPEYLKEDNLPVLNGVYDNPTPAEPEKSAKGSHHFLASDLIGLYVAYSAIDGHRFIGTQPDYLNDYTELLESDPRALEKEVVIQRSIKEALSYLTVFNTHAASRQHWIQPASFPSAELPKK